MYANDNGTFCEGNLLNFCRAEMQSHVENWNLRHAGGWIVKWIWEGISLIMKVEVEDLQENMSKVVMARDEEVWMIEGSLVDDNWIKKRTNHSLTVCFKDNAAEFNRSLETDNERNKLCISCFSMSRSVQLFYYIQTDQLIFRLLSYFLR
jgi:hypothetical protein